MAEDETCRLAHERLSAAIQDYRDALRANSGTQPGVIVAWVLALAETRYDEDGDLSDSIIWSTSPQLPSWQAGALFRRGLIATDGPVETALSDD